MIWRRYLFLLLVPVVPLAQMRIGRVLGEFRVQDESLYLWQGGQVKRLFQGFEALAADIYWLRTVQYFGGQRAFASDKRFELLEPLINIVTTLDPRMEIAYRYGAVFLSEPNPIGAGRPRSGIAVLERGVKELPLSWRLRQDLGFFHFIYLNDAHRAAGVLIEASKIPGAAYWLRFLAADLLAKGQDRRTARLMWKNMYEQAEEGVIKMNALDHLLVLDALDAADALNRLVAEFTRRNGRRPDSLDQVRLAGLLARPALDPVGVPFAYDPSTGWVTISKQSVLWRPGYEP